MPDVAEMFAVLRVNSAQVKKDVQKGLASVDATKSGESAGMTFGQGFKAKASAAFTSSTQSMAKAGVATFAVIGIASLKMAGDFQTGLNRLVTGAGETQKHLGQVSDGIKQISVDTATTTKNLLGGMYTIESAGYHGAAGLTILRAAAQGARAEGADLGTVGNALTTYMKDFHLSASQSVPAMDALVATVSHGKTTMQDLAGALHAVLPIASAAKLSYAEVGGAIATMTSHGVSAELASQHLAFMIRSLQAPTSTASREMGQFGLSAIDVAQHLGERGLTGTLTTLTTAIFDRMGPSGLVMLKAFNVSRDAAASANAMLGAMPANVRALAEEFAKGSITQHQWTASIKDLPVDQRNMAREFAFATNASHGFASSLRSNQGASETYAKALKNMTGGAVGLESALQLTGANAGDFTANVKAVGDASQHAGKNVDNWALIQKSFNFQAAQFKTGLEVTAITIGQHLLPAATAFLGWLDHSHVLLPVITGVLAVLTAAIAAQAVTWAVASARNEFGLLKMTGQVVMWAAAQTASLIETTALWVMYTFGVESAGVATAIATGGIILVLAAVAVGAYELYKHWDTVWSFVKRTAIDVYDWLKANWPLIGAILLGPVAVAALEIYKHWDTIRHLFTGALGAVKGALAGVGDAIAAPFTAGFRAVEGAWHSTTSALAGAGRSASSFFSGVYDGITGPFVHAQAFIASSFDAWWKTNGDALKQIWHDVWAGMQAVFHAVWDPLAAVIHGDWVFLQAVFRVGSEVVNAVWRAGWVALQAVFHAVWDPVVADARAGWVLMQDVFRIGSAVITGVWRVSWAIVTGVARAAWSLLTGDARAAWSLLTSTARLGWAVVTGVWHIATAVLTAMWRDAWAVMVAAGRIFWATVQLIFRVAWDVLVGIFTVAIDLLTGRWGAAWDAIKNTGTQVWNAIASFYRSQWAALTALFDSVLHNLLSAWTTTWTTVRSVARDAWHWLDSNILSPMRTMFTQTLPGWFSTAVSGIGQFWSKVQDTVRKPVAWVVDNVLDGLIRVFDSITNAVGLGKPIGEIHPFGLAAGGKVPGGFGGGDIVPALVKGGGLVLLEPGEAVVDKDTTRKNASVLASWGVPGFQSGGLFGSIGHGIASGFDAARHGIAAGAGAAGNAAGSGLDWIGHQLGKAADIAKIIADLTTGNVQAAANAFTNLIGGKSSGGAAGELGKTLLALPVKLVQDAVHWLIGQIAGLGGTGSGNDIVSYARSFLGKVPYTWGGTSATANDCSGFTQLVYHHFGYDAPRTSEEQGAWVKKTGPVAGGLAFFNSPGGGPPPGHVGIVTGPHSMISQAGPQGVLGPTVGTIASAMFTGVPPGGFTAAGGPGKATSGVARWNPLILRALAMLHLPASYLGYVDDQMQSESGGNQAAQNNTDINAQHGTPSKGLLQVIQPTFDRWHVPGTSNNIWDPLANIAAALNYSAHGAGFGTGPGQMGSMHGYAKGTDGAAAGWGWVGEEGPELVHFLGGEQVLPAGAMTLGGRIRGYAAGTTTAAQRKALEENTAALKAHARVLAAQQRAAQANAKAMATAGAGLAATYAGVSTHTTATSLHADQVKYLKEITLFYRGTSAAYRDNLVIRQTAQLTSMDTRLAGLAAKITAAQAYQGQVLTSLSAYGGLGQATGAQTSASVLSGLQGQLATLQTFGGTLKALSGAGASQALIKQVAAMAPETGATYGTAMVAALRKLKQAKAPAALVNQLVALGPDSANAYADALLAGGPALMKQITATEAAITSTKLAVSRGAASAAYEGAYNTGANFLAGLKSQDAALTKLFAKLGKTMAEEAIRWFRVPARQRPHGFAAGGQITEPMIAVGLRSGRLSALGENGIETVTPGGQHPDTNAAALLAELRMLRAELSRVPERTAAGVAHAVSGPPATAATRARIGAR